MLTFRLDGAVFIVVLTHESSWGIELDHQIWLLSVYNRPSLRFETSIIHIKIQKEDVILPYHHSFLLCCLFKCGSRGEKTLSTQTFISLCEYRRKGIHAQILGVSVLAV